MPRDVELRPPDPSLERALTELFLALRGDEAHFHPHPFTREHARSLCQEPDADYYLVAMFGPEAAGYGMLRGYAEGFSIPSLGVAVHPLHRGKGIASALLSALHDEARRRGSAKVRLRVHRENEAAVTLYRSFGYVLDGEERGQDLYFLELASVERL